MGSFSIWHWLIVLMVVLILFGGRGKISQLMGDFGKGLKSFKKSMREDESFEDQETASREQKALPNEPPLASDPVRERDRAARP
jgi:sec-independent protein translocase protein TatA